MAANTNLFNDKEINNWFKASIALNVTKQGLTNFLNTELQNLHAVVGRSCGNCPIEKLIPCPTNPYCNQRKRSYCPFHKSQKPQPCPTCDKVKQNIIFHHRYTGPSWRNTRAEKWAFDYWEIAKCFLPPDGYSSVSSVQESDFNGVISIMLSCLHFQTCLSSSCLSPPPPDKQCPLEKVRQIGRDVRHTSDCKVTDTDLQDYFQTLSTLLADPNCLQHDSLATIACMRLNDLQNDRMSLNELGNLLKEAEQTLKHAKEADERFSKEAERTLAKALDATFLFGEKRLSKKTHIGEQSLKTKTLAGKQSLKRKTQVGEQCLDSKAHIGEERIESKTKLGEHLIKRNTQLGEQCFESKTLIGGERIESKAQIGEERTESTIQLGELHIESKTHVSEQWLDSKIQDGIKRIKYNVLDGFMRLKQAANETAQQEDERGIAAAPERLSWYQIKHSPQTSWSRVDGKKSARTNVILIGKRNVDTNNIPIIDRSKTKYCPYSWRFPLSKSTDHGGRKDISWDEVLCRPDYTLSQVAFYGLLKLKDHELLNCIWNGLNLSSCPNLVKLDISGNVTLIPKALRGLPRLRHLILECKCNGLDLSSCPNLEKLDISGNVTLISNALRELRRLRHLTLECKCDGLDLSSCKNLEKIDISGHVTLLPNTLRDLRKVKSLICDCSNNLTDSITG